MQSCNRGSVNFFMVALRFKDACTTARVMRCSARGQQASGDREAARRVPPAACAMPRHAANVSPASVLEMLDCCIGYTHQAVAVGVGGKTAWAGDRLARADLDCIERQMLRYLVIGATDPQTPPRFAGVREQHAAGNRRFTQLLQMPLVRTRRSA